MNLYPCPFAGCDRQIRAFQFCCPRHKLSLNRDQKFRVDNAYDRFVTGNLDLEGAMGVHLEVLAELTAGGKL